jgi:Mg2+ and Co2+ transporter CorA
MPTACAETYPRSVYGHESTHNTFRDKLILQTAQLRKRTRLNSLTCTPHKRMTSTQAPTLETIQRELRSINDRLDLMEDLVEQIILRELPRARLSKTALDEIKKSLSEMRSGKRITLEELRSAAPESPLLLCRRDSVFLRESLGVLNVYCLKHMVRPALLRKPYLQ